MGQIYKAAVQATVWLGPGVAASDEAMVFFKQDTRSFPDKSPMPQELALAMCNQLAVNRFWGRLWIIQEVLLARELLFVWVHLLLMSISHSFAVLILLHLVLFSNLPSLLLGTALRRVGHTLLFRQDSPVKVAVPSIGIIFLSSAIQMLPMGKLSVQLQPTVT